MNRTAIAVLLVLALGPAIPAGAEDSQYSMDYWGFTHQAGSFLTGVGFVDDIQPPITADLQNFQYTWVVADLHLDSTTVDGGMQHLYFSGGTFRVYEDATWNAAYDDQWCGTSLDSTYLSGPPTFADGEMILGGLFHYLMLDYSPGLHMGAFDGRMDLVEGSHLFEIPVLLRYGWTFGGVVDERWACIPDGYEHRWDGQLFLYEGSTPTQAASWSGIKRLYR